MIAPAVRLTAEWRPFDSVQFAVSFDVWYLRDGCSWFLPPDGDDRSQVSHGTSGRIGARATAARIRRRRWASRTTHGHGEALGGCRQATRRRGGNTAATLRAASWDGAWLSTLTSDAHRGGRTAADNDGPSGSASAPRKPRLAAPRRDRQPRQESPRAGRSHLRPRRRARTPPRPRREPGSTQRGTTPGSFSSAVREGAGRRPAAAPTTTNNPTEATRINPSHPFPRTSSAAIHRGRASRKT